ncbi:MAG: hypothetical protein ACKO24_14995, partial [Leptolyngbyaceae cyanobacterium]
PSTFNSLAHPVLTSDRSSLTAMSKALLVPNPVITDPVITDPVITDPAITDPVIIDPVITDPVNLPEDKISHQEAITAPDSPTQPRGGREPLRMLVIGSRPGVTGTIHTLHRLGYAQIGEWSPLLPGPNPGEVMAILTRYLMRP